MERIAVVGATGGVGSALVPRLASDGWPLRLIGRRGDRLEALAASLPQGCDVECRKADARDSEILSNAVRGCALTVVASGTIDHAGSVGAAILQAGSDYFDVQLSSRQKLRDLRALEGAAHTANRCMITDGGYHPGVPAALVRWAYERLPGLETARVAALMREDWRRTTVDATTRREFVREIASTRYVAFEEGRWRWPKGKPPTFDFGPPFGRATCTPFGLEEMMRLPTRFPALRQTGFYIAGFDPWTDWVMVPLVFLGMRLTGGRAADFLSRRLLASMRRGSRPPFRVLLVLEAVRGNRRVCLRLEHTEGYEMTAIPAQATIRQWRDRRPGGLHLQAWFVEPESFVADLAGLGIEVTLKSEG